MEHAASHPPEDPYINLYSGLGLVVEGFICAGWLRVSFVRVGGFRLRVDGLAGGMQAPLFGVVIQISGFWFQCWGFRVQGLFSLVMGIGVPG